jgi:ferrochelatase
MGFLSEHIETLYDLDWEAKQQAQSLGLEFVRVRTLRTDPGLIGTLKRAVEAVLNREIGGLGANLTPP